MERLSTCSDPRAPGWIKRMAGGLRGFLLHSRKRWYVYLLLLIVWTLAYLRLFYIPTPQIPVLFNWTPSLPYHVAALRPFTGTPERGDYVLYRFDGEAAAQYPGLRGQPIFKQITGLPGEQVTLKGRHVYVNGTFVGDAKTHTFDGHPLEPIAATRIPPGHYFVSGTSPDSFDSRYRASGLVRAEQILGRVEPWF